MGMGKMIFWSDGENIQFYIKGRKYIRYIIFDMNKRKMEEVTKEEFDRLLKKAQNKENRRIKKEQAERAKRFEASRQQREAERQMRKESRVKSEDIHKTVREKTKGKYQMAKSEYAWNYLPTV